MKFIDLIRPTAATLRNGAQDEVCELVVDSRLARAGSVFLAQRGARTDSHPFIKAAYDAGARAFIVEDACDVPADAACALLADTRRAAGLLAARLLGDPGQNLWIAGITGTNGKTSTTYLIEALLAKQGKRPAVIGTVNYRFAGRELEAPNTTPGPLELARLLREMATAEVSHLAIEVSSHALDQFRADGLPFDAALFTNLTRDHLDYHPTMDAYAQAKRRLFAELLAESPKPRPVAIVNLDDPYGAFMLEGLPARVERWGYSHKGAPGATFAAQDISLGLAQTRFTLTACGGRYAIETPLIGHHNVANLLQALSLAAAAGLDLAQAARDLATDIRIPGRLERVADPAGRHVFVDYAHTPDALDNVLAGLNALCGAGRVITVFGCGGDRDKGKRPLMGESAGRGSRIAIATSDNPRSEEPLAILAQIVPGLEKAGLRELSASAAQAADAQGYRVIADRAEAIEAALCLARPGDCVLIAGKGHEDYQIVGTEKHHFDDVECASAVLARLGAAQ